MFRILCLALKEKEGNVAVSRTEEAETLMTGIQHHALCKIGGRKKNEDHWGVEQTASGECFVVADGLGGHGGGDVASQTAVAEVLAGFRQQPPFRPASLEQLVQVAHQTIRRGQEQEARLFRMATTLVVLWIEQGQALWAHVGDSRLYLLSKEALLFQAHDHSVPQELVERGEISPEDIRSHWSRNQLLQSLGQPGSPQPDVASRPHALQSGHAFLLATDGFWEYVWEDEMLNDWRDSDHPEAWLAQMEARLLQRVDRHHDNYTALAVQVD